jgi:steroid 5-alpha reductase family enzyme
MQGPLRIIFPLTVVLLWTMFGIGLAGGAWTPTQWAMLGLGHLCCAVIFIGFIYVFNYGYGLSVAVISAALMLLRPSLATALVGIPALAFGLRMVWFTWSRYQSASYAANYARQKQASAALPAPVRVFLWLMVSCLMSFELMAVYFAGRAGVVTPWIVAGAVVMVAGLVLEAVADAQKQAGKARNPGAFVTDGLFAVARHPNYLGEIVFQLGLIIAALGTVSGWWETAVAVLAPLYIVVLMTFAAINADADQSKRYGSDPAWQQYRARTGRFLPGL